MKQLLLTVKKTGICALLLGGIALSANAQQVIGLQKAVDLALQNNLTVKQSAFNQLFDEATYQQSKNNQLPGLSGSVNASQSFGRAIDPTTNQFNNSRSIFSLSPGINLSMILFQGGALRNTIIQNRLQVEVDKSNTTKIKNDLTLNVIIAYLQILTNQDLVLAAKQQIDISKINLDRTDKTVKAGNQTMADLSQAKAGLSTAEYNLTNAQNQLDISFLTLKQYMEMPASTQIAVERPDISKFTDVKTAFNANDVFKTAASVNPDVKLAEAQQAVAAQGIKIAKASFYPTLSLGSGMSSNYSNLQPTRQIIDPATGVVSTVPYTFGQKLSDNFSQSVGVGLQIPIFSRFNARTNVKKATISYKNAEINTQIAKNNLSKIIYQAVLDARGAANQYISAQQTYQANKDAFNVIQLRYNVGLENSLNYNTSLTNLNKSQFDMIQAQYNMIFRSKVIDYYLGNPITL
ncbi:TolC family protein [Mucilaginibacter mali]|uniref:TolC family protein n=1 Tax=Mucilaginibacter mali TaxID=2740462 RepID=A0A7D4Q3R6_9SPHI|nr:TolC family protein [Mucilaginibacter mali]QKJ32406.1 TolC family protein [Mucilaginibacter mali]